MRYNKNAKRKTSALITCIQVEKLFGRYNYDLKIPRTETNDVSRIGILYGDNGTGKTTILTLLFHLLSPATDRAHKTFLAGVPFSRFSVVFSDKTEINVIREGLNLTGSYNITLVKSDRSSLNAEMKVDENGLVTTELLSPEAEHILKELTNRGPSIFFLRDDRMLQSDEFPKDSGEQYPEETQYRARRTLHPLTIPSRRDATLRKSLERTIAWLHQRLIRESTRGEAGAQQIYASIVKELNKFDASQTKDYKAERNELMQALKALRRRSGTIAKFGLISKVNVNPLIEGLTDTEQELLPFITQVVSSFIDGQKVRLDALAELSGLLDRFVAQINACFLDKKINLNVAQGISILSNSGTLLTPENLSSGEKQLLLLFCNVLASSESASLFIIDEPEISLNVKWQRHLIDALIDITSGSQCQFLLATHSIELLTKHKNQTIKLNPRQNWVVDETG